MYINHHDGAEIDYNELATLKHVVLTAPSMEGISTSCSAIAGDLDISPQTASRRLRQLEEAGLITRDVRADGQTVFLTREGTDTLLREFREYQRIFGRETSLELEGEVASGLKEGKHYVTLPGYQEQFEAKLGYTPYPGTLNVELSGASAKRAELLGRCTAITIDWWESEGRTFGPVTCHPATLTAGAHTSDTVHALDIERTHHDDDLIELVAPICLRDRMALSDGDAVTVRLEVERASASPPDR